MEQPNSTVEVVLVATNQEGELEGVVRRLHRALPARVGDGWRLTIVDHASTDATLAVARRLSEELDHVGAVHLAERLDRRALRARWAGSSAVMVAFVEAGADTDIEQLLAPLGLVTRPDGDGRMPRLLSRRAAMVTFGGAGIGLLLAACGGSSSSSAGAGTPTSGASGSTGGAASTTGAAAGAGSTTTTTAAAAASSVPLAAEMTEGPYYLDLNLVRSNVTEDRAGAPLALDLVVVTTAGQPVRGAAVDIWHCDANGLYSGFVSASAGANRGASSATADDGTFLRGTQVTDATGKVSFTTVYPGWYMGRTVHIHVKVHVSGKVVHVGQLFFDDTFTDAVFASTSPYSSRPARDTRNARDGIFTNGGAQSVLDVKRSGSGYATTMTVGVKTA